MAIRFRPLRGAGNTNRITGRSNNSEAKLPDWRFPSKNPTKHVLLDFLRKKYVWLTSLYCVLGNWCIGRFDDTETSYLCPDGFPQVSKPKEPICLQIEFAGVSSASSVNASAHPYGVEDAVGNGPFCLQQTSSFHHVGLPYSRNFCYRGWQRWSGTTRGDFPALVQSVRLWGECEHDDEHHSPLQNTFSCDDRKMTWYIIRDDHVHLPRLMPLDTTSNSSVSAKSLQEATHLPPLGTHPWQMSQFAAALRNTTSSMQVVIPPPLPYLLNGQGPHSHHGQLRDKNLYYRAVPLKVTSCDRKECLVTKIRNKKSVLLFFLTMGAVRVPVWIVATMGSKRWALHASPLRMVSLLIVEGLCFYPLIRTCPKMTFSLFPATLACFFWSVWFLSIVHVCHDGFALWRYSRVKGSVLPNDDDIDHDEHQNPRTSRKPNPSIPTHRWVEYSLPQRMDGRSGGGVDDYYGSDNNNEKENGDETEGLLQNVAAKSTSSTSSGLVVLVEGDSEEEQGENMENEPLIKRHILIFPPSEFPSIFGGIGENDDDFELLVWPNHRKIMSVAEAKVGLSRLGFIQVMSFFAGSLFWGLLEDGMWDEVGRPWRYVGEPRSCDVWSSSPLLRAAFWTLALVPGLLFVVSRDEEEFPTSVARAVCLQHHTKNDDNRHCKAFDKGNQ